MTETTPQPATAASKLFALSAGKKHVLHVGCGPKRADKLHLAFRGPDWVEVRLDVDRRVAPDIVGSMVDLHSWIADATFDAIWSSHNLEHLDSYEVPKALAEFVRILKPTGFALITCPDLGEVASQIVDGRIDDELYVSPGGPVTPLDMMFGFGRSIQAGNKYMRHHTGFTENRLGRVLIEAGFSEVRVTKGRQYDLWALAMMREFRLEDQKELGLIF